MKRAILFCAVTLAATLLSAACEDVPSLRFPGDGGATDSGTKTDGGSDAQPKDASGDAPGCDPTSPPLGTNGCCGETACIGNNCEQLCSKCGGCTPSEYCCTQGSLRCITPGEQCQ